MKTLKLVTLVSIVLVTIASITSTAEVRADHAKNNVYISFDQAIKDPGLVQAMVEQIDNFFLQRNQIYYTAEVNYDSRVYFITGSSSQWRWFFKVRNLAPKTNKHM
jgi:hypothetical protein